MAVPLIGYGLAGLANLGRGAVAGYRTLKGIRTARKAAGMPTGLERGLGAIQKGERMLVRKSPLTAGGLETAISAPLAAEGLMDVGQGVYEGDYGQVAGGLGSLAFGVPLLGRGLRTMGMRKYDKALGTKQPGKIREALYDTGRGVQQRAPIDKRTLGAGLGLTGVGAVFERDDAQAQEPQVLSDNPVDIVINSVNYAKQNPDQAEKDLGVRPGTPEFQKLVEQRLTQAYEFAKENNIEQKLTFEEAIADVNKAQAPDAVIDAKTIIETPNVENGQLTGSPMTPGEITSVAKKLQNASEGGERIKQTALKDPNSKEAAEFNKYYERITNLTGGNDQTNNLILMKLASGLLSKKTGQTGVRGFLDVLGQAGGETTDTAMALFQKEKDRRNDLAVAYLKSKEAPKNNIAVTGKRQRIVVADPQNGLFGLNTFDKDTFTKDGRDAIMVPEFDEQGNNVGTQWVPMQYTSYTEVQPSPTRQAKDQARLNSIGLGYKMAQEVKKLPDRVLGVRGKVSDATQDIFGFITGIAQEAGFEGVDQVGGNIDNEILDKMIYAPVYEGDMMVAPSEEIRKETAKVADMYKKETSELVEQLRSGDKELAQLARAKLIETRMKYILANANKAEDRLTVADVKNAEENTQILKWFTSPEKIKSQYQALEKELEQQFKAVSTSYMQSGGTSTYITSQFGYMPEVKSYLERMGNRQRQQAIQSNVTNILGGIE